MKIKKFKMFEQLDDPFGEEDMTEYDIIVEKPGVLMKHIKGEGPRVWIYNMNEDKVDQFWAHLEKMNPGHDKFKDDRWKDFYVGYYMGQMGVNAYYEKFGK